MERPYKPKGRLTPFEELLERPYKPKGARPGIAPAAIGVLGRALGGIVGVLWPSNLGSGELTPADRAAIERDAKRTRERAAQAPPALPPVSKRETAPAKKPAPKREPLRMIDLATLPQPLPVPQSVPAPAPATKARSKPARAPAPTRRAVPEPFFRLGRLRAPTTAQVPLPAPLADLRPAPAPRPERPKPAPKTPPRPSLTPFEATGVASPPSDACRACAQQREQRRRRKRECRRKVKVEVPAHVRYLCRQSSAARR